MMQNKYFQTLIICACILGGTLLSTGTAVAVSRAPGRGPTQGAVTIISLALANKIRSNPLGSAVNKQLEALAY